jgi:dTMP kinase
MRRGIHVASERYYLSFYAYQATQGLSLEWLRSLGKGWMRPDLMIVLNTPLAQCLASIEARFARQRYENASTLRETWEQFQILMKVLISEGEQIVAVDGSGSLQEVWERVWAVVAPILDKERS